jgi:non-ribosomal peptide synthetase component F
VNLLDWKREELNFSESGVFPVLASFEFDMSVPELYLALVAGGTVAERCRSGSHRWGAHSSVT